MTLRRKSGSDLTIERLRVKRTGTVTRRALRIPTHRKYAWSAEKIGGGGWVTGITISPDGLTRLARTDVGGGWRWNSTANKWVLLITKDSMPAGDANVVPFTGVGVQALAAANGAAYMGYIDSIYKSTDRGVTWAKVKNGGIPTGANTNEQRWWGPHIAIDKTNNNRILYGSYSTGVWYSTDAGATWTNVATSTVPAGTTGYGVPVVGIDTAGNWYACPYGSGVYQSTDLGATWAKISSDATFTGVTGLACLSNGALLATATTTSSGDASTNVYRYASGSWSTISVGSSRSWRSVAEDPNSPGFVLLQANAGYHRYSLDYGASWSGMNWSMGEAESDVHWLPASAGGSSMSFINIGGLQFDPVVAHRAWMSQGIGVWYADIASPYTTAAWKAATRGLEQLVINSLTAPPGGSAVATAWDRPIFVLRENGADYPTAYHPQDAVFSAAWFIDYSADTPSALVASVANHQSAGVSTPAQSGYSTNGGTTWTPFTARPLTSTDSVNTFGYGTISISGNYLIWVSAYTHGAYYSTDMGATWTKVAISGITDAQINQRPHYIYRWPVAAEKTAGHQGTFYMFTDNAGVYRTLDGGATWTQRCGAFSTTNSIDWSWNVKLKAVPGKPGYLFLTSGRLSGTGSNGQNTATPFYRSRDGGITWTLLGLTQVTDFDFGKSYPGRSHPAIYAAGNLDGTLGMLRSVDGGDTWELLDTHPNGTPMGPWSVAASKDTYGLIWAGTPGQGVVRGDYA